MYTGEGIDTIFAEFVVGTDKIAIEDEDIPGDFYTISIKSGRLIVRKIASAGN